MWVGDENNVKDKWQNENFFPFLGRPARLTGSWRELAKKRSDGDNLAIYFTSELN